MGQIVKAISGSNLDPEAGQDQLVVKPIKTWRGYVWDTWELPKEERWLLFKVDAFVLTFASVSSYFHFPQGSKSEILTRNRSDWLLS
jgi:hypothetical protein